jgi:hypothetical protein
MDGQLAAVATLVIARIGAGTLFGEGIGILGRLGDSTSIEVNLAACRLRFIGRRRDE